MLSFWFGSVDAAGFASKETAARWFKKDPEFDQEVHARFGAVHTRLAAGEGESWLAEPRGALAYVIVLDQFSRNMFRDQPGMFASDARALAAARGVVAAGQHTALTVQERTFLYMPYMHSEALADQDECLRLFRALADEVSGDAKALLDMSVDYSGRHRDIVARFGRFPHRNKILGRTSTGEEATFLEQSGSSF